MAERPKPTRVRLRFSDEATFKIVRVILAYESAVRGRSINQTCYELLLEGVDIDSYPEEVRARLAEIEEEIRQRAVEKSLESEGLE